MKDQIENDLKKKFLEGGFSEGVGYGEERLPPTQPDAIPDEELQARIIERLENDLHVVGDDIAVSVNYGEVVLTGTVPNRNMMNAAIDSIREIAGVTKITNEMTIKP